MGDIEAGGWWRRWRGRRYDRLVKLKIVGCNLRGLAEDDGAFDRVSEFTHVARKAVGLKLFDCVGREALYCSADFLGLLREEVFGEQCDVIRAFPQRWQVHGDGVQTVKKVFAKGTFGNGLRQVTVGRGNDAQVDR